MKNGLFEPNPAVPQEPRNERRHQEWTDKYLIKGLPVECDHCGMTERFGEASWNYPAAHHGKPYTGEFLTEVVPGENEIFISLYKGYSGTNGCLSSVGCIGLGEVRAIYSDERKTWKVTYSTAVGFYERKEPQIISLDCDEQR